MRQFITGKVKKARLSKDKENCYKEVTRKIHN